MKQACKSFEWINSYDDDATIVVVSTMRWKFDLPEIVE